MAMENEEQNLNGNQNTKLPELPMDVIQYCILPLTHHLQQIDHVMNKILQVLESNKNCSYSREIQVVDLLKDLATKGETSAIAYLVKEYRLGQDDLNIALRCAASSGQLNAVTYICGLLSSNNTFDNDKRIDFENDSTDMSRNHDVHEVTSAVSHLDNTEYNYNYALRSAAWNGHLSIVKFLCESVDLNGRKLCKFSQRGTYDLAIKWAACRGWLHVLSYLCESLLVVDDDHNRDTSIIDPNQQEYILLHATRCANRNGHPHIVNYLENFQRKLMI